MDLERVTIPAGDHRNIGTRASALARICASITAIRVTVIAGKEWPRSDTPSKSIPAVKLTLKDKAYLDRQGNSGFQRTFSRTSSDRAETSPQAFASVQARLSAAREHLTPTFLGDHSNPHFNDSFELFLYGSDG